MKRMIFRFSVLFTAALSAFLFSCTHTPVSYTVSGVLPDSSLNGATLYIYDFDSGENLDSTIVSQNKFEFTGAARGSVLARIDAPKGLYANFILENGNILLDLTRHRSRNTPLNDELARLLDTIDSLYMAGDKFSNETESRILSKEITEEEGKIRRKEYHQNVWKPAYIAKITDYYERNKENGISYIAFINVHDFLDNARFDSLIRTASPEFLNKQNVRFTVEAREALKKTAEGMMFTDFSVDTPDGGKISLSDYVGKGNYVLADFWASWCGPCRAEIPFLAQIYEKYKNKGLVVLGIAVWDEPNATVKAVTEEKIAWPQIINAGDIPAKLYGIQGIPHTILFGPDGTILARDLRGESLKEAIAKAIEKKRL